MVDSTIVKKREVDPSVRQASQRLMEIVWNQETVFKRGPVSQSSALSYTLFSVDFFNQVLEFALDQKMLYIIIPDNPPYDPMLSIHPPKESEPSIGIVAQYLHEQGVKVWR